MKKRIELDVDKFNSRGRCEDCKYRADGVEICQLRNCFRAFIMLKDAFEERNEKDGN